MADPVPMDDALRTGVEDASAWRITGGTPLGLSKIEAQVDCLAVTDNWRWLFTGDSEGMLRRYDVLATYNVKSILTRSQTRGLHPSLESDAVMESDVEVGEHVTSLAVHPDGLWIVTGTVTGKIGVFTVRIEEGECHITLEAHEKCVSGCVLLGSGLPSGSTMVTASWDGTCRLWDLNTATSSVTYNEHTAQVTDLVRDRSDPNAWFTSSLDGTVRRWDARMAQSAAVLVGDVQATVGGTSSPVWIYAVDAMPDGTRAYGGLKNGTVAEWDLRTNTVARSIKMLSSDPVTAVTVCPDRRHVATGSATDGLRLWDVSADEAARKADKPQQKLANVAVPGHNGGSPSSILVDDELRFMVSASGDRGWGTPTDRLVLYYDMQVERA